MGRTSRKDIPGQLGLFDPTPAAKSDITAADLQKENTIDDLKSIFGDTPCSSLKRDPKKALLDFSGYYCEVFGDPCTYPDCTAYTPKFKNKK